MFNEYDVASSRVTGPLFFRATTKHLLVAWLPINHVREVGTHRTLRVREYRKKPLRVPCCEHRASTQLLFHGCIQIKPLKHELHMSCTCLYWSCNPIRPVFWNTDKSSSILHTRQNILTSLSLMVLSYINPTHVSPSFVSHVLHTLARTLGYHLHSPHHGT